MLPGGGGSHIRSVNAHINKFSSTNEKPELQTRLLAPDACALSAVNVRAIRPSLLEVQSRRGAAAALFPGCVCVCVIQMEGVDSLSGRRTCCCRDATVHVVVVLFWLPFWLLQLI